MDALKPAVKVVSLNGRNITITELSLKKIAKLADVLASLKDEEGVFKGLGSGDTPQVINGIAGLMRVIPGKVAEIVSIGTDAPADAVMDMTPNMIVDLLAEIWEINNLARLFQKKVMPLLGGAASAATNPTPQSPT